MKPVVCMYVKAEEKKCIKECTLKESFSWTCMNQNVEEFLKKFEKKDVFAPSTVLLPPASPYILPQAKTPSKEGKTTLKK